MRYIFVQLGWVFAWMVGIVLSIPALIGIIITGVLISLVLGSVLSLAFAWLWVWSRIEEVYHG